MERLEGSDRRRAIPVDEIVSRMNVEKGETILDLGAGTGYFSLPLSRAAGQVVALDIEPKMLALLANRGRDSVVANLELVRAEIVELPIAQGAVDRVLAAFVYHEVANPRKLVEEAARVLADCGRLTVLDFQKRPTEIGPPVSERRTPEEVLHTTMDLFDHVSRYDSEVFYHLELFRKATCPTSSRREP